MNDNKMKLVVYATLGSIARKLKLLSEIDNHAQKVLNPRYPKPSRAAIKVAAHKNFRRTLHLLRKGKK